MRPDFLHRLKNMLQQIECRSTRKIPSGIILKLDIEEISETIKTMLLFSLS